MELGETEIKDSPSVTINSELLFPKELKVGGFNLLDKSAIPNGLSLSLNKYLFESIILKQNQEFTDISANFSTTNEEESSLRSSIEERNRLVEEEHINYIGDSRYASGFSSGILYESVGDQFQNRAALVDYMNNKTHKSDTILYGWDHHTEYGKRGTIERKIGKIASVDLI